MKEAVSQNQDLIRSQGKEGLKMSTELSGIMSYYVGRAIYAFLRLTAESEGIFS